MATIADYPDAIERIAASDVATSSTTRQAVLNDLAGADAPQITSDVAEQMADAILTEDRVKDAIDESGELPSDDELSSLVSLSDDYGMDDRQNVVESAVREDVATVEDVDAAVDAQTPSDRQMFAEDVDDAIDSVADSKEFRGASKESVAHEEARERGTPERSDFERESAQLVAQSEQVTPSDVLDDTRAGTPAQVIRGDDGDVAAVTGGPSDEIGEQIAAEYGADYMDASEVSESLRTSGSGERVDLQLRGKTVGEVDVR